jgi:hypothetical protein
MKKREREKQMRRRKHIQRQRKRQRQKERQRQRYLLAEKETEERLFKLCNYKDISFEQIIFEIRFLLKNNSMK